jgi:membrane protease subunit HflC
MNRITLVAILAVLGIGTYVLMSSIYTVSEVEQAIITQFGEPVGAPVTTAGLKLKVPFIQDVNLIDKQVLEWDGIRLICQPRTSSTSRSISAS